MATPLQPDLRPAPAWWRRALLLLALVAAVFALGFAVQARRRPPEVLFSDGEPYAYARALERRLALAEDGVRVAMFVARLEGDPDAAPADDPVAALLRALRDAHRRGVDVRVCLDAGRNWETGEPEAKHEAALTWLRAQGVPVVADELEVTTHAKAVVIDRRWVLMGSHNWTRAALTRNREVSLLLDDPALARRIEEGLFRRIPGFLE